MADEYDANAGGNRRSLLTGILANVLWTLRLQELVKQRVLWNVYASVFSRLSVTEWVDVKSDLSLQTSELVRVLFAVCSMTHVPTTMATLCLHLWSIIGSLKLISTLRLSIQTVGQASGFVQPWMGDSATPRSNTSSTWSRWYRPHRFVGICLAFNWFESICLLFTVYDYCTIKQVFIWHVYYNKIQVTTHIGWTGEVYFNPIHMCNKFLPFYTTICYFINIQSRQWTYHHLKAYSIFYNLLIQTTDFK